jgi:hypothetical protein
VEAKENLRGLSPGDEETPDRRLGAPPTVNPAEAKARKVVGDIEKSIADASVVGVFKAPTAEEQAAEHDRLNQAQADDPEHPNVVVLQKAKQSILDTFSHFEGPGRVKIDVLNKEHLAELLGVWSHGEVVTLATRIMDASVGAPDVPFSVRQSLQAPRSAATSKPR